MHRADIKAALSKKGVTLTAFDKQNGFVQNSTSNALRTGAPSVELALSEFLDLSLYTLFPDRYRRDGVRLNPRDRRKNTPKRAAKSSPDKKVSAA